MDCEPQEDLRDARSYDVKKAREVFRLLWDIVASVVKRRRWTTNPLRRLGMEVADRVAAMPKI